MDGGLPAALVLLLNLLGSQEPSQEERLKKLEEELRRQQAEIDELKKAKSREEEFRITFTEGVHVKSSDGAFDLHFGGRYEEQFRGIADRPDSSRTFPNTFYTREAFIQADGTLYHDWGFRVSGNFPSSNPNVAPGATLVIGYVEWKAYREFTLLFGQFKAPISQETAVTSPLFTDPIERSMLSRFVPNYEMGILAYGSIEGGLLGYQAAVINGRNHLSSFGRGRNDDNDAKEADFRVTTMPWVADRDSAAHGLRLGAYASIGDESDVPMPGNFDIFTPALNVTYLQSTAGVLNGRRTRLGAELSWAWGPFSLRGEVMRRVDEVVGSGVDERMPIDTWYGQVTWILTGEDKVVETRITPAHPFDLAKGDWGAVEAVFLVSQAVIGRQFEDVGNSLAGQSNRIVTYTAGVNWYPVKNVRIAANIVREDYRNDVAFTPTDRRRALNGFLARFQVDF